MIQATKIQAAYRGWGARRLMFVAESCFDRFCDEIEFKIKSEYPSYEHTTVESISLKKRYI